LDLDTYRDEAESFCEAIDREHYLHLAGHKPDLEIEAIYARHGALFQRDSVERLRGLADGAAGEKERRLRHLLHFALDGLLGHETAPQAVEAARLEADLEVQVAGGPVAYRKVSAGQANEPDGARRAELEAARDAVLDERLNPLHREALERAHALCRELGWRGYAHAYGELRGLDMASLAERTGAFLEATADVYAPAVDPCLDEAGLPQLGLARRSDLARFFRAPALDGPFDPARMIPSLGETLAALGIDLDSQANVHLDVEARPTKSPRAFCSTPRIPDEIYLVVSPVGGRDDYSALFHEGGHVEHFAGMGRDLDFEFRHLGDNAITESFAFLFEHLTEDPAWLRRRLGLEDPRPVLAHARAVRLIMLRRYAAKLSYELRLHADQPDLKAMPATYADTLSEATRVPYSTAAWLNDVDPGFYVVCYLRAWALEASWRRRLRERFGEEWFTEAEAGEWLRGLWREGQRHSAEELAERELGEELDFGALADELAG